MHRDLNCSLQGLAQIDLQRSLSGIGGRASPIELEPSLSFGQNETRPTASSLSRVHQSCNSDGCWLEDLRPTRPKVWKGRAANVKVFSWTLLVGAQDTSTQST